jgi:hypothetical protein
MCAPHVEQNRAEIGFTVRQAGQPTPSARPIGVAQSGQKAAVGGTVAPHLEQPPGVLGMA